MANPERGEVAMLVGGLSYKMQLSLNALACLKKQTGKGIQAIAAALQENAEDPDFELISAVIWASLRDHHPDVTLEQAAGLFPAGGLEEILAKVGELFAAAFPAASRAAAANPPKAATTT